MDDETKEPTSDLTFVTGTRQNTLTEDTTGTDNNSPNQLTHPSGTRKTPRHGPWSNSTPKDVNSHDPKLSVPDHIIGNSQHAIAIADGPVTTLPMNSTHGYHSPHHVAEIPLAPILHSTSRVTPTHGSWSHTNQSAHSKSTLAPIKKSLRSNKPQKNTNLPPPDSATNRSDALTALPESTQPIAFHSASRVYDPE